MLIPIQAQTLEERMSVAEGNKQYLLKNYAGAVENYAQALVKNPENIKANFNIANAYYETKQYEKAQKYYMKVAQIAKKPQIKAQAYYNEGNTLMRMKNYPEAIAAYKNALRNNPSDSQARYNLVLAQKLQDSKHQKNPPDLPKPSAYAKQVKEKADQMAAQGRFTEAYRLMSEALLKDSTVNHFQPYIKKLNEVIILDTIKTTQ